jgi:NAD(P)-dependent dehydrogenase (short-subunit alcohol dehydrogenase family)
MGKLTGKNALITGGTSGIGLATAKLFVQEGARLVVTGRSEPALSAAKKELGPNTLVVKSDSGKLADIDALIEQTKGHVDRLDVLFLNAGVAKFAPINMVTEESFDEQLSTNLKGTFFTLQKALPILRSGASVLMTASIAGKMALPASTVHATTKAAVRALGRAAAAELIMRRIRVNVLSPGPVETAIYSKAGMTAGAASEMKNDLMVQVPLGRLGQADEIARAALFLASEDSSFITGIELSVDGGMSEL